jgi:hypothetical protein
LENLKEKDEFLATYDWPNLNQEDINNLSRSIISNEIKAIIINLSTLRSPGLDGFTTEFYQTSEKRINTNAPQTIP